MSYLWKCVNRFCSKEIREGMFLALNIFCWTFATLAVGLLFCVAAGGVSVGDCVANVMCIAVYAGIIFGLFGGIVHLMRAKG